MKFTLSVAVLALAASQAMAVVPTPIQGCTKTVIVQPTDLSCVDFATANGCTFDDLLKWNTRLSKACDNLDVGAPICVSMTPGAASTGAPSNVPTNVPTTAGPAPTNPAGSVAPTSAVGTQTSAPAGATSSAASTATSAPPSPKATSSASGSKASMALAAAGVLLSVAYML